MRNKARLIAGLLATVVTFTAMAQPELMAASGRTEIITQVEAPEESKEPEVPKESETPAEPENPKEPQIPVETEAPAEQKIPEGTEAPAEQKIPEGTEAPAEQKIPEGTEAPAEQKIPEGTEAPAEPETPTKPEEEPVEKQFKLEGEETTEKELPLGALELPTETIKPHITEVNDLSSFIEAVSQAAKKDNLIPDYIFEKNSSEAIVEGETVNMGASCTEEGGDYVVPKGVFENDQRVNEEALPKDDGAVSIETLVQATDYEVSKQEGKVSLTDTFKSKRLIVRSPQGFDPQGARAIIQGYQDIYVLTYATEEDAKSAFQALSGIEHLTVEPDNILEVSHISEEESTVDAPQQEQQKNDSKQPTGEPITVAVIDSGYDVASRTDRVTEGADLSGAGNIQDQNGHGTAMGNILLDHASQSVQLMPVKVTNAEGRTSALKLYLGISYAAENGADIINVSLTALNSMYGELVADAIKKAKEKGIYVIVSAGNAGEDTAGYTPANVEEAITVSAVNADKTLDVYSNHGATIDYCSYGAVITKGLELKEVTVSGTSVSAAIVSAVAAQVKSLSPPNTWEDMFTLLNEKAEDLGEPGRDNQYGQGLLTLDTIKELEEEKEKNPLPELLTCDYKNLSDSQLNDIIAGTDYVFLRKFLDKLTKEEKTQLLNREVMFHNDHVTVSYDQEGNESSRTVSTLYEYLYSKDFEEYQTQYYIYHANMTAKVKLNTSLDAAYGELTVYAPGIATNPVDNDVYRKGVKVGGTSGGAINMKNVSFKEFKTFTDDSGNPDTIGQYGVQGIVIDKPQGYHLNMTKTGDVYIYGGSWWSKKYTPSDGSWTGGYTVPSSVSGKSCSTTSVTADVMVGEWDFVAKDGDGKAVNQAYTLNFQGGSMQTDYSGWEIIKRATCTTAGKQKRDITYTCKKCNGSYGGGQETINTNPLDHQWSGNWIYQDNNGVPAGYRFEQCRRNCGETGWQRNPQYWQEIYFRYMDENGNYPGYTTHVPGAYYPAGTYIPACQHIDDGSTVYKTHYGVAAQNATAAHKEYIDIARKQYTVNFDGNGATAGATPSHVNVCCGKTFTLNPNGYLRKGHLFQGWSKGKNGPVSYHDKQSVSNLMMTSGKIDLSAVWKPIVYTIRYDGNGATGGSTQESVHTYGELKTLTPNGFVRDGYDFAGWSTTPDGSGERLEDGSKLKEDLSETEGEVVTLYALWKCFNVTYFRNAYEKESEDKMKEDLHHRYTEPYEVSEYEGNNKEQGLMTVDEIIQKDILPEWEWIDNRNEDAVLRVGTRERENEETEEMEEIPAVYSLAGWSVAPDSVPIVDDKTRFTDIYGFQKYKSYQEMQVLNEPLEMVDESVKYQEANRKTKGVAVTRVGEPFIGEVNVSLNAIWDSYPVIHLTERFFTLEDAKAGKITPEEILSRIKVTDDEDGEGEEKILDPSKVRIIDYNPVEIERFNGTGSFTLKIEAEDSAKNVSTRMMRVSIADTRAKEVKPPGEVRFISDKYYDDLPENSVWKADPDYKRLILNSFENLRYHEETAKIAEVKFMGKVYRKKIPGSGGWKRRPAQIWYLDHAEVLKLQDYVDKNFEKSIRENNGISEEYLQGVYDMLKADGCLIEDNLPEIERQNEALKEQREREKKQQVIQEKQQENR